MPQSKQNEYAVYSFASAAEWREWLASNHQSVQGIWLRFFKKNAAQKGLSYAAALDEALCFGWIDSQVRKYDEISYLQKFTPRQPKSIWSKVNTQHIERLMAEGKMAPAGLAQVAAAKADGRWQQAYDSPVTIAIPNDFLSALAQNKKAEAFFKTISKANQYAIAWRLQTAKKPETRQNRIITIVAMLERGETFH